ncbi:MAG: carbohydrate binding domain-containing protein [Tannerella sp.]|jgi:alpha-L-arabinofuranosidase|nr:carbohydrate binding domain-containing protein [Tannerella sp.]
MVLKAKNSLLNINIAKRIITLCALFSLSFSVMAQDVYLFSYFTNKNSNKNGLHFAYSEDGYKWMAIGPEHSFLRCDYGNWGTEKKMRDPFILQGPDGIWHCIWTINWESNKIGYAASKDLIHWGRQSYIPVMAELAEVRNCWAPEMIYDEEKQQFIIFWASTIKVDGEWVVEKDMKYDHRMYYTTTKDFKTFAPAKLFFDPGHNVIDATIRKIDDTYYMIYKDERELPAPQKTLLVATSKNAEGPYKPISGEPFTKSWVEGPATAQLPDGSFIVYMDAYREKKYEALRTNDFITWEDVTDKLSMVEPASHGTVVKTSRATVDALIWEAYTKAERQKKLDERVSIEMPSKEPVNATLTIEGAIGKPISDKLIGIFFEDISYAADGGLYAELVQNRDFEYTPDDVAGRDSLWNSFKAWSITGEATYEIDTLNPIHPNNPHYIILKTSSIGAGLSNEGYDGITLKAGETYNFSMFAKSADGKKGKIAVRLIGENNMVLAEKTISLSDNNWKKYNTTLKVSNSADSGRLEISPRQTGNIAMDMISLFPQKTFKNRPNGLRTDLAQTIADLHPRFVRFPGGCVAHGDGLDNMYRWKNTIGPLESRKPQPNIWRYHQSMGLGYFEYFQFCEDLGAEPIPILPAAVCCQNSQKDGQEGIPMCKMEDYIQEVFDLVEYANGDVRTTYGKMRAEAGHPAPFNLKYIGIGNEDLITDAFEERFTMIYNAMKEKHPEITVIGTVGPFCEGTDYEEGWKISDKLNLQMVDEHYYQTPGWFLNNQNFYDKYDRARSAKVYLGEYAAHLPGRPNNLESALVEALYLASLERNGDVVEMTSYAPLLAKEKHTNWNPDLIYFNNKEVKPTVGYYVQQLYGQNSGDRYLSNKLALSNTEENITKHVASSVVRDSKNDDMIIKLVNLLPVTVNTNVNIQGIENIIPEAKMAVLKGDNLSDKDAQPQTSDIRISPSFNYGMPAHSFTVIRIKTK